MLHLVDGGVYANCGRCAGKRLIEACLAHIGSETVDALEPRGRVHREKVGPETHVWTVLEVRILEGEVTGALVGVVGEVDVGDFSEGRAGIFGERMERQAIEDYGEDLWFD
jgi:hypothetical protein